MEKFHWLAEPFADAALRDEIIDAVRRLDDIPVGELTVLLAPSARRCSGPEPGDGCKSSAKKDCEYSLSMLVSHHPNDAEDRQ